tara:strand:- start:6727 stop:8160 length:1434 start_codon:yes stop_codon:yes gene_type:complete
MAIKPNLSNVLIPDLENELSVFDKLEQFIPTAEEKNKARELRLTEQRQQKEDAMQLFLEYEKQYPYLSDKRNLAETLKIPEIMEVLNARVTDKVISDEEALKEMNGISFTYGTVDENIKEIVNLFRSIDPEGEYRDYAKSLANQKLKGIEMRSSQDIATFDMNLNTFNAKKQQLLTYNSNLNTAKQELNKQTLDSEDMVTVEINGLPTKIPFDRQGLDENNQPFMSYTSLTNTLEEQIINMGEEIKKHNYYTNNPLERALELYPSDDPPPPPPPFDFEEYSEKNPLGADIINNLDIVDDIDMSMTDVASQELIDSMTDTIFDIQDITGDMRTKGSLGFVFYGDKFTEEEQERFKGGIDSLISDIKSLTGDENAVPDYLKALDNIQFTYDGKFDVEYPEGTELIDPQALTLTRDSDLQQLESVRKKLEKPNLSTNQKERLQKQEQELMRRLKTNLYQQEIQKYFNNLIQQKTPYIRQG